MYEKVTRAIRVRVRPEYLEAQSAPDEGRFFWSYTVEIVNEGSETMQLRSRYWRIADANGRVEEVRGPGVVGQTPVIGPGQSFEYTRPNSRNSSFARSVVSGRTCPRFVRPSSIAHQRW